MQEDARMNLAAKMSTLASKHSLAFENLTSAVADAKKLKLPGDVALRVCIMRVRVCLCLCAYMLCFLAMDSTGW